MDIRCVVCGEPYDVYLDMLPWEKELFRKGAGCPCCEGVEPETPWEPETLEDIENGDGDPIDRLVLIEERANRPKWERPEDTVLWTCEGCGVEVRKSQDDGELYYDLPYKAKGHAWYVSHPYNRGDPEEEPAHVFEPDTPVCEFCLTHCAHCGKPVSGILEYGDPYEDGWCSTLEGYGYTDVFCIDCVESSCGQCGSLPEDCDCCHECGSTKDNCSCDKGEEE